MSWYRSLQRVAFGGVELPAEVRARLELARDRVASREGLILTCAGVSMEPAIRLGDRVRVRPGQARRGAVAAFVNRRGTFELHRLVLSVPGLDWWVHAGDNQVSDELGLVHRSQIVGVADVARALPRAALTARAALRLARAAARLTVALALDDREAAWRHVPSTGAPAEPPPR
ncbi:MAG TPA: S24/S26 family peptidase [Kofleriaceae bacterium]|nr:S24/S26 family peptidase [Kofleriaceae bacterium]